VTGRLYAGKYTQAADSDSIELMHTRYVLIIFQVHGRRKFNDAITAELKEGSKRSAHGERESIQVDGRRQLKEKQSTNKRYP
jgi:hypothetical protein